jgi:hypothetical protein
VTVTVGWVDGGTVAGGFAASVAKLCAYEASQGRLAAIGHNFSGPLMCEGRNTLVESMLESDGEWFLMTDSDMTFTYDAAERLHATAELNDVKMVGGLAFGVNATLGQFPTMYTMQDGMPAALMDIPPSKIVEVDATGAAFTLMHRTLFEDYRRDEYHPWFHRRFIPTNGRHKGGWLGEDLSWCLWLRDKGERILVDTSVEVGHMKWTTLNRETRFLDDDRPRP